MTSTSARANAIVLAACLLATLSSACTSSQAVLLTISRDGCVLEYDYVELEVSVEGGSLVWSSVEVPDFLIDGPQEVAIAVDRDVESVQVKARAYLGTKMVGSRTRTVDLSSRSYAEQDITLEGCTCGSRDVEFCEPFDGDFVFGWQDSCNCSGGDCSNTFVIADPGDSIDGDALRFTVGADASPSEPCTRFRPISDAGAGDDLYMRAFVRMSAPVDPGWEETVSFIGMFGSSGSWWAYQGGFVLPTLEGVGYYEDGANTEVMDVTDSMEPVLPIDEWFCMEISTVGGDLRLAVDGVTYEMMERDGGTTPPRVPGNWQNLEIDFGTPRLWYDASDWEIWFDEIAFDFEPLPCPAPDAL